MVASPLAIETNSLPASTRSPPKRLSKMRRTAGTKELPPVRNTRSTSPTEIEALASTLSSAPSMASSSSSIHFSNCARVMVLSISKPAARNENGAASALDSASLASVTALYSGYPWSDSTRRMKRPTFSGSSLNRATSFSSRNPRECFMIESSCQWAKLAKHERGSSRFLPMLRYVVPLPSWGSTTWSMIR